MNPTNLMEFKKEDVLVFIHELVRSTREETLKAVLPETEKSSTNLSPYNQGLIHGFDSARTAIQHRAKELWGIKI